jgi:hypothetical protein
MATVEVTRPEYQDLPLRQRRLREAGLDELELEGEDSEQEEPEIVDAGAERVCPECKGPLPSRRKVTCSPSCARVHKLRAGRARDRKRRRPAGAAVTSRSSADVVSVVAPPASANGCDSRPAPGRAATSIALADELEACAGMLRRIAGRLIG